MMKAIPFMTDDEMMELLAANMTIYFEDYQEIKKAYTNSLEGLKDILGNEKYEIIEDLIKRKDCFSTHYVRVDFLEQVVLAEIRRLTRFACKYEDQFVRVVSDFSKQAMQSQIDAHQSEVRSLMARDKELDRIFERLYEDNLSGKITDERFQRMSVNYDNEQKDLRERLTRLNNILEELNCKTTSTEKFVEAVRKYTRVKKLTARMVTELIEHIEVHHTEKIDGVKTQKLVIYYNCIGSIEIPDEVPIPEADITMKTRKGVEVTYVPAAIPATTAV